MRHFISGSISCAGLVLGSDGWFKGSEICLLTSQWSLEKKKGYVHLVIMVLRVAVCVFFGVYGVLWTPEILSITLMAGARFGLGKDVGWVSFSF